jgi:rod shape determining protein RodA
LNPFGTMIDRRLIHNFDWGLLLIVVLLGAVGLTTVYSAVTADPPPAAQRVLFYKQMIWFALGWVVMTASFSFSYRVLERWAHPIYIVCVLLLLGVVVFGKLAGGSRRWLALGPLHLQPSELIKIAIVLVLAKYFSKGSDPRGAGLRELVRPMLMTALPCGLIVIQPDLGTAGLVGLIAVTIALFVKVERRTLLLLVASAGALIPFIWSLLKEYQKQRILTFLNPDQDPLGSGYHIIQSKIAIGSGMIYGKGYLQGTQNALSFLPEEHTDFIFSVLAEEWGAVGSMLVLLLFLILILRGLSIAHRCRDPFGTILAVGITALLAWQVMINVGMTMGLMPVVGVPLPLISYGGSSTLTVSICIGVLMNIRMRRFLVE